MRNVFFVGELIADLVESGTGSSRFESRFGGCSYFGCIAASRVVRLNFADDKVHYIGPISKDTFGDRFYEELEDHAVKVDTAVRTDRKTTVALVVTSPGVENGFSFYDEGTTVRDMRADEIQIPELPQGSENVFVYGSVSTTLPGVRDVLLAHAEAMRPNGLIYFDLNARPSVISRVPDYQGLVDRWAKVADVIKASDFDIQTAYPGKSIRDVAARWLENGASLAVVTFGNRGSWALRLENGRLKEYHIPCETPLEAPFTVGAGDSFNAGLCLELFKGSDLLMMRRGEYVHGSINAALRAGNSSASLHLKENGAYPRPAESRSADGIEPTPVLQMPPRLPNLIDYAPDPRPSRSIQP